MTEEEIYNRNTKITDKINVLKYWKPISTGLFLCWMIYIFSKSFTLEYILSKSETLQYIFMIIACAISGEC